MKDSVSFIMIGGEGCPWQRVLAQQGWDSIILGSIGQIGQLNEFINELDTLNRAKIEKQNFAIFEIKVQNMIFKINFDFGRWYFRVKKK